MCGRFNITSDPLSQFLMAALGVNYTGQTNFNFAPTESTPVLRSTREGGVELIPMRWWLTPHWSKDATARYATFNAKVESAATKPAFREAYRNKRCVVPVSGFYEWCRQQSHKVPYYITPSIEQGLLLAGLWDEWRDPTNGEVLLSFTLLTTAAHKRMQQIHHRQPVMLSAAQARQWLDLSISTDELHEFFDAHLPTGLQAVPVSSHVNNARNKDVRCIEPIGRSVDLGGKS